MCALDMATNSKQHTWKLLRRLAALLHGRLPTWAILILVLFGGGGVFYAAHDFLKKQQSTPPRTSQTAFALPVSIEASFLPEYATTMPTAVFVRVSDTGDITLPNLKLVFDFENAPLQSCEPRASNIAQSNPTKNGGSSIYVLNLPQFLPEEKVELYCLAENPQKLTVTLNSLDSDGKSLGFANQTFTKSIGGDASGFRDFLIVLVSILLSLLACCFLYILFGLTGRLARWLGLFPEAPKNNPPTG